MKKRIYIAPAQTVVEMDAKDAMMQLVVTSIPESKDSGDDLGQGEEGSILSTGDDGFGWHSTIWDED
ncbi:MAG: hypothetical protein J6B92_06070 [Paraprevotella sp.]|nr:hypothetical protein [Paraprevotella sp.]